MTTGEEARPVGPQRGPFNPASWVLVVSALFVVSWSVLIFLTYLLVMLIHEMCRSWFV